LPELKASDAKVKAGTGNPNARTVSNLVVLTAFKDHYDASDPDLISQFGFPWDHYKILFMHDNDNHGPHKSGIAPRGSVRDYFRHNSYGAFELETDVARWGGAKATNWDDNELGEYVWVKLPEPEAYYQDNSRDLLFDTMDRLEAQLNNDGDINLAEFDANGDGVIDCLTLIHSGYDYLNGYFNGFRSGVYYLDPMDPWISSAKQGPVAVTSFCVGPALWGSPFEPGVEISRTGIFAYLMARYPVGLPSLQDSDGGGNGVGFSDL
ncbi:MAG: hypothetical protein GY869_30365, partial [Planctomycetes bacterium]|nr:hypothetical protein [Planctomycetota bacterium]